MSKIRLKVCGMRDEANIREIVAIQPDYLGFIFYPQSPRYVGKNFELGLFPHAGERVGVFVNEKVNGIMTLLQNIAAITAQLHGNESPDECQKLRDLGVRVIKAISVGADFDPVSISKYNKVADYLLFDTKGKLYGGNAAKFDWKLLERYDQELPFFLSGGISVEDLEAISQVKNMNLHAIDMNSGIEISPGLKDPSLVRKAKKIIENL